MTEHYTADEIRMKLRYAEPTLKQWRQRFDDLYRSTLMPAIFWRLECLDLMRRAQFQLTYTPDIMAAVPTEAQKLKAAIAALRRIARLAGPGTVIYEIATKATRS